MNCTLGGAQGGGGGGGGGLSIHKCKLQEHVVGSKRIVIGCKHHYMPAMPPAHWSGVEYFSVV